MIFLVNYCFKSGVTPAPCEAIGDINCSGHVTAADIISLVDYIFGIAANSAGGMMKGGGDPPCNICRLLQDGTWGCF